MWQVSFRSAEFLPYLPEACQANPGVYGFELAHWLSRELARRGMATSYPLGEDWGWFIEHIDGEAEIMIGCASVSDEDEGYRGEAIEWRIFVRPAGSVTGWLRRRQPADTSRIESTIEQVLRDAGIEAARDAEA
jgi:hypothetical protein